MHSALLTAQFGAHRHQIDVAGALVSVQVVPCLGSVNAMCRRCVRGPCSACGALHAELTPPADRRPLRRGGQRVERGAHARDLYGRGRRATARITRSRTRERHWHAGDGVRREGRQGTSCLDMHALCQCARAAMPGPFHEMQGRCEHSRVLEHTVRTRTPTVWAWGVPTRVAAQVVATDAPWVMELLRFNAQLPDNADAYAASGGMLTVSELIWGVDGDETCDALLLAHGSMDVVVACECVYAMEEGSLGDIYGHSFQVSVVLHGVCDGLSRPLPAAPSRAICHCCGRPQTSHHVMTVYCHDAQSLWAPSICPVLHPVFVHALERPAPGLDPGPIIFSFSSQSFC